MFSDLILARARRREQHTGPFRVVESAHNVIVIFAVKLDIEHKAVGEPNPPLATWAALNALSASMEKTIVSPLSCSTSTVLPRPSALRLPLRISKPNTL